MFIQLRDYARTAVEEYRFQGPAVLAWRVVLKLLAPIAAVSHQILFDYDLTQPIDARPARIPCEIGPASPAEIEEIVAARFPPLHAYDRARLTDEQEFVLAQAERERARLEEAFRRRCVQWMRSGEKCFIARVDGEIVHSNWLRFDWCTPAAERPILLLPGEIYMTEAHTVDHMRGKAIHGAVNAAMLRHAQSLGCKIAYTITDFMKAGSRRGVIQVGWRYRGNHVFLSLRGTQRTWILRLAGDVEPVLRELLGADPDQREQTA